jgi:hypothetical protein
MRSPTPSFFVCFAVFVLRLGLLVLYKYWPSPTCMFFSLVIISLLLVILACSLISNSVLSTFGLYTESLFSVTRPLLNFYSQSEDFSASIPYLHSGP